MPKAANMRKIARLLALVLVLSALFSAVMPAPAHAQNTAVNNVSDVLNVCRILKTTIAATDLDGIWFSEYLVACIKHSITNAFLQFLIGFYGAVERPIQAAITLSVVLFGGLMLGGMIEKPARDSMVFLLKLASIVYFVQVSTALWVFDSSIRVMDGLTDAVYSVGAMTGGGVRCFDTVTIWDEVDCTLDILIGIRKDDPENSIEARPHPVSPDKYGISRGLLYFFFTNLTSSGTGAIVIAALGLYSCIAFVFALIKTFHTYLVAILALAFIFMMMPMFVPLFLFKATRNYFDKWYRIAISFILQPVILFAFLALMMMAMDTLFVSGQYSVLNMIKGENCENQVPNECLEQRGAFQQRSLTQYRQVTNNAPITGALNNDSTGALIGGRATALGTRLSEGQLQGLSRIARPFDGVNYQRLAQGMGAADEGEAKKLLGYAAIISALTMFIFISMLNYIPVMATDLAGGVFEVPNLYDKVGSHLLGGEQLERGMRGVSQQVRSRISNNVLQPLEDLVSRRS